MMRITLNHAVRPIPWIAVAVFTVAVFVAGTATAGEVYRYTDEQGRVHYTDEPPPAYEDSAEKVELDGIQTYTPQRAQTKPREPEREPDVEATRRYESVTITRPSNEQTLRDPQPTLTVSVQTTPPLRTKLGHQLRYFFNGKPVGAATTATSRTIPDVYRGTHTLQVIVVDRGGRQVAQSPTIRVFKKPPTVN